MNSEREEIDSERKHLEILLMNRISFYLIFAPVYLQFVYQSTLESWMRMVALGVGTVASILLGLAIWRTEGLVQEALNEIKGFADPEHPYARYKKLVLCPWNANKVLLGIPVVITFLFAVLTYASLPSCFCQP
jgi:hypothetical protein